MVRAIKPIRVLLSFVGINDAGKLDNKPDGVILSALTNGTFDEVILLWNNTNRKGVDFQDISFYLKKEALSRKLCKKVMLVELSIKDVADHNQIYPKLKVFCDSLDKSKNNLYSASISSGTPAMQVCWILLAESGDFSDKNPLNLFRVRDPRFGISENIPVHLDTALPRIQKMKKDLMPIAVIDIVKGQLKIGNIIIDLTPMEFCYYRYFAERVRDGLGSEKFSGFWTTRKFLESIYHFHEESYPDLYSMRDTIQKMLKEEVDLLLTTFRGNVTKANKKIHREMKNDTLATEFEISSEGNRGAKFYGLKASAVKIVIK
jgi:hypothetical protein